MSTNINGVALGAVATGSLLIYASITGKSILKTIQSMVQGNNPMLLPTAEGISGGTGTAATDAAGNSATPVGNPTTYQAYAFSLFSQYGWGTDQQQYLVELWTKESGWNVTAKNPSSGAYGIPQSLPASKMASAGSDYLTNYQTQIKWGLGYIHDRYGTPQMAWAHEEANNWY